MTQKEYLFGIEGETDFALKVDSFLKSDVDNESKQAIENIIDQAGIHYLYDLITWFFNNTAQKINAGLTEAQVMILFTYNSYELVSPVLRLIEHGLAVNWSGLANSIYGYNAVVNEILVNGELTKEGYQEALSVFED